MTETISPPASASGGIRDLAAMGSFIKISHTLFSLPLVFAGLFVGAGGWPDLRTLVLALVAAAGARTSAMALNRIIDRKIDAQNARTRVRELPSGRLSLSRAWAVTVFGGALYLAAAWALGPFILAISPIPLVVFVAYPYLKRFTPLCHFGVGIALGLSPWAGWLAVRQTWSGSAEILPLAVFGVLWVAGFDIIYATLDRDFDRAHGVHSIPARLGNRGAIRVSGWVHVLAWLSLALLWVTSGWTAWALVPLGAVAVTLFMEHRMAENVELAFFNLNIVVGFVVLAFVSIGVFWP
ncbi:MAG: putative 4-hydroxybenzoate polyprenyltransferase [Candidatus Eisenbacteria bacterium]|uniref:4-hydroxybenzoate polyprenyltransferase n=1 Tax=Eiseniibacteriota bacterium TaxID=2212470 RepID=A0A956ND55_UNCEI|nr:putative 4-hydroxybenzoate polyprenyltransferase [Candidatus Eisenbacteria bacterium]MCB9463389.1 UbiA family prenyltransferase [Candidatus Eisenbacteria bacterium]